MARPKSDFLKALGTMFEIWKALTEAVLSAGGTDEDIRRVGTDPELRARIAQLIVTKPIKTYTLYLSPAQKTGGTIKGWDLNQYLTDQRLLDRTVSLDDDVVKGWLADPTRYPEEYKGKAVFLWKSQRVSGSYRSVADLVLNDGHVIVYWYWLDYVWFGGSPVLLAS